MGSLKYFITSFDISTLRIKPGIDFLSKGKGGRRYGI
jgi:hypothetical protein